MSVIIFSSLWGKIWIESKQESFRFIKNHYPILSSDNCANCDKRDIQKLPKQKTPVRKRDIKAGKKTPICQNIKNLFASCVTAHARSLKSISIYIWKDLQHQCQHGCD